MDNIDISHVGDDLAKAYEKGYEDGKPKWIPVTERLPEAEYGESEDVLTIDSLKVMRVAYFDGGNWCYPTGEVISTTCKFHITHWMPLPEPPKEEKDG